VNLDQLLPYAPLFVPLLVAILALFGVVLSQRLCYGQKARARAVPDTSAGLSRVERVFAAWLGPFAGYSAQKWRAALYGALGELLAEKLRLYSRVLQENGRSLRRAVVSSNANTCDVLVAAGIEGFFEARIDGVVAQREGLKGRPAPDTFLAGARALGVAPAQAAVFEDALAGVAAGRAGGFAWVVGVDRVGQAGALRERGASIVVSDLSEQLEDR
jgi:HAD superfamily hydrolase (TIGR01509 family)